MVAPRFSAWPAMIAYCGLYLYAGRPPLRFIFTPPGNSSISSGSGSGASIGSGPGLAVRLGLGFLPSARSAAALTSSLVGFRRGGRITHPLMLHDLIAAQLLGLFGERVEIADKLVEDGADLAAIRGFFLVGLGDDFHQRAGLMGGEHRGHIIVE